MTRRKVLMGLVIVAAAPLTATSLAADGAAAEADARSWRVFEVGRLGDVAVRLRVLRTASMTDEGWLAIEFENRGKEPVELRHPGYWAKCQCLDSKTGDVRSFGGLASGNAYDMFPEFWKTTSVAPIVLGPGVRRIIDQPSFYSAALLGLGPKDGYLVKASFRIRLDIKGHGRLELPTEGVPFEFRWVYPDEQGFAVMQKRLKSLLATSTSKMHQAYYIHALLEVPGVAQALSVDELLAAIERREGGGSGRNYIAEHLDKRFSKAAEVISYYRGRLAAGDRKVLDDLRRTEHIWDDSFVEPLVRMFEADPRKHNEVLHILLIHGRQQGDPKIARRMSAALLAANPILRSKPDELTEEQLRRWSWSVRELGLTGDREAIALVRPYLDVRTPIRQEQIALALEMGPSPPLRACDCALDAILTILDGDAAKSYPTTGFKPLARDHQQREKAMAEIRDRMIGELKKRLSRLDAAHRAK